MDEEEIKNTSLGILVVTAIVFGISLWLSESFLFSSIFSFFSFLGFWYLIYTDVRRRKKATEALIEFSKFEEEKRLKLADEIYQEYQRAIKSGNKMEALSLGRDYYRTLREDEALSIYDEQAIANDLSVMR